MKSLNNNELVMGEYIMGVAFEKVTPRIVSELTVYNQNCLMSPNHDS